MFERGKRADNAVFVKAVTPVGAAVKRAIHAVDLVLALLRGHTRRRVKRMIVVQPLDDLPGAMFAVRLSVTQKVWRELRFCRMFML